LGFRTGRDQKCKITHAARECQFQVHVTNPAHDYNWDSGQEMQVVDGYWKRRSGLVRRFTQAMDRFLTQAAQLFRLHEKKSDAIAKLQWGMVPSLLVSSALPQLPLDLHHEDMGFMDHSLVWFGTLSHSCSFLLLAPLALFFSDDDVAKKS
jgi:hypothetical protein